MRALTLLLACVLLAGTTFAQGVSYNSQAYTFLQQNPNQVVQYIPNANVSVCIGTVIPPFGAVCTGTLASLFQDSALTIFANNPLTTDQNGNFSFYISPGQYTVSIWKPGFTTFTYPLTVIGTVGGTVTNFTAGNLSPLFTTSVATPTATPNLTFALSNTSGAGLFFAGPAASGGAPTYRTIVSSDVPPINLAVTTNGGVTGLLPPSNEQPGTNGQCKITSGAGATWGSCAGTAGLQLLNQSTAVNSVNAATNTKQTWPLFCSPCFPAGVLNASGKTIEMDFMGNGTWASNTGNNVDFGIYFNSLTTFVPSGIVIPTGTTTIWNFEMRLYCVTTTTGASGQLTCNEWGWLTDANGINYPMIALNFVVGTLDLTSSINVGAFVHFNTSSISNKGTTDFFILKQDN